MRKDEHVFTIKDTYYRVDHYYVSCSCNKLHMPTHESEIGALIRIHLQHVNSGETKTLEET